MRTGTPGFQPERLTQAREARGLTAAELAAKLGVTSQTVSQYEHASQTPSPEVMNKLATALGLPHAFFRSEPPASRRDGIFYRSMTSATKGARTRAERRLEWLKETTAHLSEYVEFPKPNLPAVSVPAPRKIKNSQIEEIALECRRHWELGTGPIPDVIAVLENNGIIVSRIPLGAETLDAFSQWPEPAGPPFVVLGSEKGSAVRSRFDAAHELGHLLLHRRVSAEDFSDPDTYRLIEDQAHRFAGAFLLTADRFKEELWALTLGGFYALKPRWKVSMGVMIKRCEHLKIMSPTQVQRSWINMSRRGWRKFEPLDDELPPERPRLLQTAFEVLVDEGGKPPEEILSELCLPAAEVEELAGLPAGFFGTRGATEVVRPRMRRRTPEGGTTD